MRIAFFGTPTPAAHLLETLLCEGVDVAPVITAEDKPKGRGLQPEPTPVKRLAIERGLKVLTPKNLKDPQFLEVFREYQADAALVCAYGRLIPKTLLSSLPKGFVNVHYSLLPKYRGASCVAFAILFGETITGVSFMLLDEGLDTGPLLAQFPLTIHKEDTADSLTQRLTELAKAQLIPVLRDYLEGRLHPKPQEGEASYCPLLKKEDAWIDFNLEPEVLVALTNAMNPWPKAYCFWKKERILIHKASAHPLDDLHTLSLPKGTAIKMGHTFGILAKGGLFVPELIQREGRQAVNNAQFLRGLSEILQTPFTGRCP